MMNDIATALHALADYQIEHADFGFVAERPDLLSPAEMTARAAEVRRIAGELKTLAVDAETRPIAYDDFDSLRRGFQPLGKLPPQRFVSDVARAIVAAEVRRTEAGVPA